MSNRWNWVAAAGQAGVDVSREHPKCSGVGREWQTGVVSAPAAKKWVRFPPPVQAGTRVLRRRPRKDDGAFSGLVDLSTERQEQSTRDGILEVVAPLVPGVTTTTKRQLAFTMNFRKPGTSIRLLTSDVPSPCSRQFGTRSVKKTEMRCQASDVRCHLSRRHLRRGTSGQRIDLDP